MKYILLIILSLLNIILVAPGMAVDQTSLPDPDRMVFQPLRFKPPQAHRHTLENGIELFHIEDHELPLVNVTAVFRTGAVYDPPGKAGLAELTHRVMRSGGTTAMSGNDLDDLLALHGIQLTLGADMDQGTAHLSVLKPDLALGFDLFSRILRNPGFAEDKFQLTRNLSIEDLRGILDNPQKHAFREFRKLLYQNTPRGMLATIRSLKNIQRSDLIDFHEQYFKPNHVMLAVTGDLTLKEAIDLVQKHLGDWQGVANNKKIEQPDAERTGNTYLLEKETPQSIIVAGQTAPSKRDADFYAFTVLNFILGDGGFRSRMFEEIRSNRGLAYSTGSFYKAAVDFGIFGTYAFTKTASTSAVLTLMRNIIEDMKIKGVSPEELSWARKSINNSFIFSFQSVHQIASQQMMLAFDRLPDDFILTYPDKIDKIKIEDLQKTANRYFGNKKAVTLILGNEKGFVTPFSNPGNIIKIKGDL